MSPSQSHPFPSSATFLRCQKTSTRHRHGKRQTPFLRVNVRGRMDIFPRVVRLRCRRGFPTITSASLEGKSAIVRAVIGCDKGRGGGRTCPLSSADISQMRKYARQLILLPLREGCHVRDKHIRGRAGLFFCQVSRAEAEMVLIVRRRWKAKAQREWHVRDKGKEWEKREEMWKMMNRSLVWRTWAKVEIYISKD